MKKITVLTLILLGSISVMHAQKFTVECEGDSTRICFLDELECDCNNSYTVTFQGVTYQGILEKGSSGYCFKIPAIPEVTGMIVVKSSHPGCINPCQIPAVDSMFWLTCPKVLCGNFRLYADTKPQGYVYDTVYHVEADYAVFDLNNEWVPDSTEIYIGDSLIVAVSFGGNNYYQNMGKYGPLIWSNGMFVKFSLETFPGFVDMVESIKTPELGLCRFYVKLPNDKCTIRVRIISNTGFTVWRSFLHCFDTIPRILSDTIVYNDCKPMNVLGNDIATDTTLLSYWVNSGGCEVTRYHIVNYEPISDIFSDTSICYPIWIGQEYVNKSKVVALQRDSAGCKFTEYIDVLYSPPNSEMVTQTICLGDFVLGTQVFSDTLITQLTMNSYGCVDTVRYDVHVDKVSDIKIDTTVCPGEMVADIAVYSDTTIITTGQTPLGCIYTTIWTVQVLFVQDIVSDTLICAGKTFANHVISEDTVITMTHSTPDGCAYNEIISVYVEDPADIAIDTTFCFQGTVYGQLYTTSTITTILRYTPQGCPFEEVVNVTIIAPVDQYVDTFICGPMLMYDEYVTKPTVVTTKGYTPEGCEFTIFITVEFTDPPTETIYYDICQLPRLIDSVVVVADTTFIHKHLDHDGCYVLYEYVVDVIEQPEVEFTTPNVFCGKLQVVVSILNPNYEDIAGTIGKQEFHVFANADIQLGKSILKYGNNQLEIILSKEGCLYFDYIQFEIDSCSVFVPNAFSPNGDGINDKFYPQSKHGEVAKVINFAVYDRWGDHIYHNVDFPPNDPLYGWDGRFRGEIMDSGVYVWSAEVIFVDGTSETLKGDVTISK